MTSANSPRPVTSANSPCLHEIDDPESETPDGRLYGAGRPVPNGVPVGGLQEEDGLPGLFRVACHRIPWGVSFLQGSQMAVVVTEE